MISELALLLFCVTMPCVGLAELIVKGEQYGPRWARWCFTFVVGLGFVTGSAITVRFLVKYGELGL